MAHDFGGALNLSNRLFRGFGSRYDINRRRAHRIVDKPGIGAGRHQRLIELMRDRGGELTHAAKPRQTRMRFLLQTQLRFGTPPLGNQFTGNQARHRQDEHECLEGRYVECSGRKKLDAQDQPELRDQNPDTDTFRTGADSKPDDRQEEHIEQLELLFFRQAKHQRQGYADRNKLERCFCRHWQDAAARQCK